MRPAGALTADSTPQLVDLIPQTIDNELPRAHSRETGTFVISCIGICPLRCLSAGALLA